MALFLNLKVVLSLFFNSIILRFFVVPGITPGSLTHARQVSLLYTTSLRQPTRKTQATSVSPQPLPFSVPLLLHPVHQPWPVPHPSFHHPQTFHQCFKLLSTMLSLGTQSARHGCFCLTDLTVERHTGKKARNETPGRGPSRE